VLCLRELAPDLMCGYSEKLLHESFLSLWWWSPPTSPSLSSGLLPAELAFDWFELLRLLAGLISTINADSRLLPDGVMLSDPRLLPAGLTFGLIVSITVELRLLLPGDAAGLGYK
jgi:hypothetical protein